MAGAPLQVTREEVVAFRRATGGLDRRLPAGPASLRAAAWLGLQDSMPRAAVASLHARVEGVTASSWEDPALVQLWGLRHSVYVVAAEDVGVFTLGLAPDDAAGAARAGELAARLRHALGGASRRFGDVGDELGLRNANLLRYAATTGTVLLRWDGARQPTVRCVEPPTVDPVAARLELARRHLHVQGPATPASLADWSGLPARAAAAAHLALAAELIPVATPIGASWILAADEDELRRPRHGPAPARLVPSGDALSLLQGAERSLLVPDPTHRSLLWTPRVWPGAVLVDGEVVGTWRRAGTTVDLDAWGRLTPTQVDAVEAEALLLPVPEPVRRLRWTGPSAS